MNYPASIPVAFGSVVTRCKELVLPELIALNPKIKTLNYIYSPALELKETLTQMLAAISKSKLRFPLIWLEENIVENRTALDGFYASVNLHVYIMYHTKQEYKSDEREENVFDPILRPIYWRLMEAISESPVFNQPDEFQGIPHTKTDHKFLGTNGQTENFLSDFVDAIEISGLQLRVNYDGCMTIIPFLND